MPEDGRTRGSILAKEEQRNDLGGRIRNEERKRAFMQIALLLNVPGLLTRLDVFALKFRVSVKNRLHISFLYIFISFSLCAKYEIFTPHNRRTAITLPFVCDTPSGGSKRWCVCCASRLHGEWIRAYIFPGKGAISWAKHGRR